MITTVIPNCIPVISHGMVPRRLVPRRLITQTSNLQNIKKRKSKLIIQGNENGTVHHDESMNETNENGGAYKELDVAHRVQLRFGEVPCTVDLKGRDGGVD